MNEIDEALYDEAIVAIHSVFEGTSQQETRASLQGLRDEIDLLLESCG